MSLATQLHIVLVDLDESTATDLSRMLSALNHHVSQRSQDMESADMVFCHSESVGRALPGGVHAGVPVVAVSRKADENSWLEALQKGADDYLPVPCEPVEIRWILESHRDRNSAKCATA